VRLPLSRYGRRELWLYGTGLAVAAVLSGIVFPYVTPVFVLLLAFVFCFFRDPTREVPGEPGLLVAPADGRVTGIVECDEQLLGGKACRVSIFLSLFDVHLNRAPCSGRVESMTYHPGRFTSAMNSDSARVNESNTIVIESDEVPGVRVVVKQVAGVLARRIVCDCTVGRTLARGERLGMIKFGSRTELSVPIGRLTELRVSEGDRVRAGVSVIGVIQ
jgi:phosphatidylserine decarboxylase